MLIFFAVTISVGSALISQIFRMRHIITLSYFPMNYYGDINYFVPRIRHSELHSSRVLLRRQPLHPQFNVNR